MSHFSKGLGRSRQLRWREHSNSRRSPLRRRRLDASATPGHCSRRTSLRYRGLVLALSLAFTTLPLLVSCSSAPSRTAQPPPQTPPRTIQFRGLDSDYRGVSTVSPDQQLTHRKEPHD